MNFFKSKQVKHEHGHGHDHPLHLHHVLNRFHTHLTNFVRILPDPFSSNNYKPPPSHIKHSWARIADQFQNFSSPSAVDHDDQFKKNISLSGDGEEIKQRLNEVSVYRLRGCNQDVMPVSSNVVKRGAVFYFFSEQDAEIVWRKLNRFECNREKGLQLSNVPLAEILEIEGEESPPRLVPDISQVKNAIKERKKAGFRGDSFSGVPVFQSDALKATVDERSTRPAFFRKEDLEKALQEEKELNPTNTDREIIQVTALEDIIQEMKDSATSKWNDVVFIPPGKGKL